MQSKFVTFLKCSNCDSKKLETELFEKNEYQSIKNGRIICTNCKEWYKIENSIIDLLPVELRDYEKYKRFSKKWNLKFQEKNKSGFSDLQQRQMNFFKEESKVYDTDITNSIFYQASNKLCLYEWISKIEPPKIILDIGGGTGRQSIPLAEAGNFVVSVDISEEMLKITQEKSHKKGLDNRVEFITADANKFPFQSEIFDAAICSSTLHHVPDPKNTIQEAARILKKGGLWYSYDPHKTPFRFVFEFAMKLKKLYEEEASAKPLIKSVQLKQWCEEAGLNVHIRYHTFILPHFINLLSLNNAYKILKFTDALFGTVPLFKKSGGVIISDGIKVN